MRVDVLYFGVLKSLFAAEREDIQLESGATVADLLTRLDQRRKPDQAVWKSLALAVNREYAGRETLLREGDEVALLPPVSGGWSAR